MSYFSFLASFVCFLILVLAGLFDWALGDFDAIAWGLMFLALGHFLGGGVAWVRSKTA